jgi:hypothetical protein
MAAQVGSIPSGSGHDHQDVPQHPPAGGAGGPGKPMTPEEQSLAKQVDAATEIGRT